MATPTHRRSDRQAGEQAPRNALHKCPRTGCDRPCTRTRPHKVCHDDCRFAVWAARRKRDAGAPLLAKPVPKYTPGSRSVDRLLGVMADGRWYSLGALAALTRCPEASVSARLRDLRKARYGGFVVERRRSVTRMFGVFVYRVQLESLGSGPKGGRP